MNQYKGLTAKQAAEGLMKGIEIFLNEKGYSLKYPLKETKMLMIIEQAIESAIETELASARTAAEQAQRDADKLRESLARWIPEYDDCEEAGKDEYGDAILKECETDQLRADRELLGTLSLPSAIRGGEKERGA
jgi:hypothetical protein